MEEILDILAPCGLNCVKCLSHKDSKIKNLSSELQKELGNFDKYAERFSDFRPAFKNYPAFKELLDTFTQGSCEGCRSGGCKYPDCGVYNCYKEKGIDFCYQCEEFPCEKSNFKGDLKSRWISTNSRISEIGPEAYIEETKNQLRYT